MDSRCAQAIATAAGQLGVEVELRADYSGRGMYGKTTAALVYASLGELLAAVALAGATATEHEYGADDMAAELEKVRTDSMGRSEMIY